MPEATLLWRFWLADLAGVTLPTLENPQVPIDPYGPFAPLFTFGDCSGYLGPGMCSRLWDDFEDFDQAADGSPETYDTYRHFSYIRFRSRCAEQGGSSPLRAAALWVATRPFPAAGPLGAYLDQNQTK